MLNYETINFYPYNLLNKNGKKYLIASKKGGIYPVDDTVLKVLDFDGKSFNEADEYFKNNNLEKDFIETIESMNKSMIIKSKENDELIDNSKKFDINYLAVELFVTQGCNLRCKYCYGDGGEYNDKGIMDASTGKDALDFAIKNCKRDQITIVFFGGEPLINFQLIKELVEYSKTVAKNCNKKVKFSTTTNSILVTDEIADFFKENNFSITVSIDGDEEIHNANRYYIDKKGSYDDVIKGVKTLMKSGNNPVARATANPKNMDMLRTQEHLEGVGFKKAYISPSMNLFTEKDDFEKLEKQYNDLLKKFDEYLENEEYSKIKLMDTIYKILLKVNSAGFRNRFCGAGASMIAIDRTGMLYPCHRFVGTNEYIIGNIYDGIDNEKFAIESSDNFALASRDKCNECWAYALCGGGCPNENYFYNGTSTQPIEGYCTIQKNLITEVVKRYVDLSSMQKKNLFKRK